MISGFWINGTLNPVYSVQTRKSTVDMTCRIAESRVGICANDAYACSCTPEFDALSTSYVIATSS